jgi:hypothetical protein
MLLLVLGLMIFLGLGVALLELVIRRADVGAALVFLSAIAQAVFIYEVPGVRVAGARVGVTDVVAVTVLAAAAARCLRLRRYDRYRRWVILLGILLLVSLLQGVVGHGIQAGVNDSRQYIFFVGAALYMATFPPSAGLHHRIGRVWLVAAVLMMLLACLRWLNVFADIDLGVPAERNGVDTASRVLDGPYAFFLGGALMLTIPFWRRGQAGWVRWLGALLLIFVIVLDRRTVWLAMLVGVAVLVLRGRRLGPRVVALVVAVSIVTGLAFAGDVLIRDKSAPGTVSSTGSVGWRVKGWSDLVASWSESPMNVISGKPFGSGFNRQVEGTEVNTHPHNFYIETMIRAGIGGLIALVALSAGLLRRLWRIPSVGGGFLVGPGVIPSLLAMQVIWYLTWVPGIEQGIVTGMAIAVAGAVARRTTGGRIRLASSSPHRTPATDQRSAT